MAETLTTQSDRELIEALEERRKALKEFRFGLAGARVRNVREGRALRREIARILTERSRRKRAAHN